MSDPRPLDARFLAALEEISPGLAHITRSHLQGAVIHVGLASEILKGAHVDPAEKRDKLERSLEKARLALASLDQSLGRMQETTRPARPTTDRFDLRDLLRRVESWIGPAFAERRTTLQIALPETRVPVDGAQDAMLRALVVVLVQAGLALASGETLEVRLDAEGALEAKGAPVQRWLPAVTDVIQDIGGVLDPGPQGSAVAIRFPIRSRAC